VAARLQARESRNWGSILRMATSLSLLQSIQTGCASNHSSYPVHTKGSFSCGTAGNIYSAEIKNEWQNTSTPMCVYGVHRHTSYYQKVWAVHAECKRKDINHSKQIA